MTANNSHVQAEQTAPQTKPKFKPFKHNGISHMTSLPFISSKPKKHGRNWFDIKPTGDYAIDNNMGMTCAVMFLKALRDDDKNVGGTLQSIVLQLMEHEDADKMKGVVVGFSYELDCALRHYAMNSCAALDLRSYDQLLGQLAAFKAEKPTANKKPD